MSNQSSFSSFYSLINAAYASGNVKAAQALRSQLTRLEAARVIEMLELGQSIDALFN